MLVQSCRWCEAQPDVTSGRGCPHPTQATTSVVQAAQKPVSKLFVYIIVLLPTNACFSVYNVRMCVYMCVCSLQDAQSDLNSGRGCPHPTQATTSVAQAAQKPVSKLFVYILVLLPTNACFFCVQCMQVCAPLLVTCKCTCIKNAVVQQND